MPPFKLTHQCKHGLCSRLIFQAFRLLIPSLFLIATLLAYPRAASASKTFWLAEDLGDGSVAIVVEFKDDEIWGDSWWFAIVEIETGYLIDVKPIGNPNPETDGDDGLAPSHEQIQHELKKLLEGSSAMSRWNPDFHWLLQDLMQQGKIPGHEIDPWDIANLHRPSEFDAGFHLGFGVGIPLAEWIGSFKQNGRNAADEVAKKLETEDRATDRYGEDALRSVHETEYPLVNPAPIWDSWMRQPSRGDR